MAVAAVVCAYVPVAKLARSSTTKRRSQVAMRVCYQTKCGRSIVARLQISVSTCRGHGAGARMAQPDRHVVLEESAMSKHTRLDNFLRVAALLVPALLAGGTFFWSAGGVVA